MVAHGDNSQAASPEKRQSRTADRHSLSLLSGTASLNGTGIVKLLSFTTREGAEAVGVLTADGIRVLTDTPEAQSVRELSPMRRLLKQTGGDISRIQNGLSDYSRTDIEEVVLNVPVPDPTKIIGAPVNYADHQNEMKQDLNIRSLGVFLKAPSSLLPAGGTIQLPYFDRQVDQEGELAVVIGKRASHVAPEKASNFVAGFAALLDITMRGREDRSTRKSFDTFTPMGPWLVTPDEVGATENLELRCAVNNTLRQDARVGDLMWGVTELISYVSSIMVLYPGDIIATGTPAGVGPLLDGDNVSLEITGLGRLEVNVTSSGAVECPTSGGGEWLPSRD